MEITQDELADKLGGLVDDPEFTAAAVFAELRADRATGPAREAMDDFTKRT